MTGHLNVSVTNPEDNLPLFLIDSEGMGIKGEAFDFITTSPPAIIAKSILWIGAENVQTAKILEDIQDYLNGLDNIVLESEKSVYCTEKIYGHLIVVINKMMGNTSDAELILKGQFFMAATQQTTQQSM